ncbi:MAG: phage portal protein [Victivallaceae bacterium]|nr:phage portal protein [Victivallaceae bacterium]
MKPNGKYLYYPDGRRMEIKVSPRPAFQARMISGWNRQVTARFDAAQTTHDNRRHWAAAENLSADAEATSTVRQVLRNRARYEISNNSYAKGIVLTLANDVIGTGPQLQMLTDYDELNRQIEQDFMLWSAATRLPEKLRTMRMARCQDGEAFAVMGTNPRVMHEIKLDIMLIEADQITSGFGISLDSNEVDGITFDAFGNPDAYRVLKQHPGGTRFSRYDEAVVIPAEAMLHCFRIDRPGQHRGVPELTPALPIFSQLRRFTLAVLTAAEAAADFAGILYTDAPPNGEADDVDPMALVELERNMLLTMPGGWKMDQLDPKQPATTYAEYVDKLIDEAVRCVLMPSNIAKGNSSGYNYASGRLDHQVYFKAIRVDQSFIASVILDRILMGWLREYSLLNPVAYLIFRRPLPPHAWFWDGLTHVDPQKEARAQDIRLKNHSTTLANEYALAGRDWEAEIRQRAREKKLMRELGLTDEDATPSQNNHDEKEEDDMDDE